MRYQANARPVAALCLAALGLSACGGGSDGFAGNGNSDAELGGLYFSAKDGQAGEELWKSDGTSENTRLLKDIAGSGAGSGPSAFFRVGERVLFAAATPAEGRELWRTDGSASGTELVKAILPGSNGGVDLSDAVVFQGALYFAASDGSMGEELWRSDGTAAGTEQLADINAGADSSGPANFAVLDDKLYFSAFGDSGGELWRTDGTETGTERVTNINAAGGAFPRKLTVLDDTLLFFADDGSTGVELWRSDGSPASTATQVADINPGAEDSEPGTACGPGFEPTVFDGQLYFNANDGSNGVEMWRSDGTNAERVTDINSSGNSLPCEPTVADGNFYFVAQDDNFDEDLYRLDSAAGAMTPVVKVNTNASDILPSALTVLNGDIYFSARADGVGFNDELWRTDGLGGGIEKVAEINPANDDGSQPRGMIAFEDTLYFGADDGSTGTELWRSDGTEQGTERVKDINPSGDGDPAFLFGTP